MMKTTPGVPPWWFSLGGECKRGARREQVWVLVGLE